MLKFLQNSTGKILNLFFQDSEKEYYLREIGKHLQLEPGHFQATLNKLVAEGILKDQRKGNLRIFRLNKDYPLLDEFKKIISKTLGIEKKLKHLVTNYSKIKYAFIFGSCAAGNETSLSDIDLMLIGQVNEDDLIKKTNLMENELKREINYHIYSEREVQKKLVQKNDFFIKIFKEPKIILKGNLDEFAKFNSAGKFKTI